MKPSDETPYRGPGIGEFGRRLVDCWLDRKRKQAEVRRFLEKDFVFFVKGRSEYQDAYRHVIAQLKEPEPAFHDRGRFVEVMLRRWLEIVLFHGVKEEQADYAAPAESPDYALLYDQFKAGGFPEDVAITVQFLMEQSGDSSLAGFTEAYRTACREVDHER